MITTLVVTMEIRKVNEIFDRRDNQKYNWQDFQSAMYHEMMPYEEKSLTHFFIFFTAVKYTERP